MKKFYTRVNKPQWRDTIPKFSFKKSPKDPEAACKRRSGSYDVQEAQRQFEKSLCVSDDGVDSEEEEYQDASDCLSIGKFNLTDNNVYAELDVSKNCEEQTIEYDVPRISFKFLDKNEDDANYENMENNTDLKQENESSKEITYETFNITPVRKKNETKITLTAVEIDFENYNEEVNSKTLEENLDSTLTNEENPKDNRVLRKCDSEPYLAIQSRYDNDLYKVPRSLKSHRLSQSLSDFQPDSTEEIQSKTIEDTISEVTAPTVKSEKTWRILKSKFNDALQDQAAQQRVGAFDDKSINLEEMYKNSKSKCCRMLKHTSKFFAKSKKSPKSKDSPKSDTNGDVRIDISDPRDLRTSNVRLNDKVSLNDSVSTLGRNGGIRAAFGKIKSSVEGQNGFDDLRRYVKQGSDFCKELATILQERADAETTYAKSLSKLSAKLSRACREGVGGLNEAWKAVAVELEARAESHRLLGTALLEEAAKPLKNVTENQQKTRKQSENAVDKASKLLSEWRANEAKGKKHSHSCSRENEKLQDVALLDNSRYGKATLSRSTSLIHLGNHKNVTEKENTKLEVKKKKAEDAVKKADIEYYTLCVRAERARLEWETSVNKGVDTFQALEEERLNNLKNALTSYLNHSNEHVPRLAEATERLKLPIAQSDPTKDLSTFVTLRQSSQQISEQLLPDFYCEHITLAMNRERRKQALIKLLHLIRQDIERERKSKAGLENLSKAIKLTPNFGAEDSQQNVTEKLYHMKSMLTYLEAARYKVQNALAELDSMPKAGHPLAAHITITRDKSGLQQSILKVPQWLREEIIDCDNSPMSHKSLGSDKSDPLVNDLDHEQNYWPDRGAADGNSNQPDSDFDEFSSQCSSNVGAKTNDENSVQPIAQCKALYPYTPNLNDELSLRPGDVLSVYRQQDDGWWLGECNGNVGIFPATYVEIIG